MLRVFIDPPRFSTDGSDYFCARPGYSSDVIDSCFVTVDSYSWTNLVNCFTKRCPDSVLHYVVFDLFHSQVNFVGDNYDVVLSLSFKGFFHYKCGLYKCLCMFLSAKMQKFIFKDQIKPCIYG